MASAGPAVSLSPFDGWWNQEASECSDPESSTNLDIQGTKVVGYEWGGDVIAVQWADERNATADLDFWDINLTDADERPIVRRQSWRLSMSRDDENLTIRVNAYEPQTYVRCRRNRL